MNNNRPLSEHEGALFDAVLALGATLLEMGADAARLRERLDAARSAADALGNRHGVETLDFLIAGLFQPATPDAPTPGEPEAQSRPSFRIV